MMERQATMGPGMMDGGPGMMGMGDACPVLIAGTTVHAAHTSDGMAMVFATTGDVAELRRRVHVMADRMNAHTSRAPGGMGMHGMMMGADGGTGTMGDGMMPATRANVEDVDHGARLNMAPVDPANLAEMRDRMERHAQMMNESHGCATVADAGR